MILLCSVDLPAKAIVANSKQYNGKHGCNTCEDEGVKGPGPARYWPYDPSGGILRTHDSIIQNAKTATETGADAVKYPMQLLP